MTNGHKDADGKFHPHSDSSSKLSSHQVESSKHSSVNHDDVSKLKNKKSKNIEVDITNHNYTFETDGKLYKLSLGNWTDAGWYWHGEEDQLLGFMLRLGDDLQSDFIQKTEGKLTFEDMKPTLLINIDEGEGLYQISGDNTKWKFGQDGEMMMDTENQEFEDIVLEYDLSDEQEEKLRDEYYMQHEESFESFKASSAGKNLQEKLKDVVKNSNSFDDFFLEIHDESFTYDAMEATMEYGSEEVYGAIDRAIKKLGYKKSDDN